MKSHYSSLGAAALAMATTATALIKPPPPVAKTTMTEGFPWRNPFASSDISSFAPDCEVSKTFPASEYTLHDLFEMPPKGLWPWGEALKTFFQGRQYPGGWAGLDHHMYNRNLLMMEYADVPIRVREWIEEEDRSGGEGKGLFAVFAKPKEEGDTIEATVVPPEATAAIDRSLDKEKVAMFAPGAMYSILPLWVAEGSKCPGRTTQIIRVAPDTTNHTANKVLLLLRHATRPQKVQCPTQRR